MAGKLAASLLLDAPHHRAGLHTYSVHFSVISGKRGQPFPANLLIWLAPVEGFEPPTQRLTAASCCQRSAVL